MVWKGGMEKIRKRLKIGFIDWILLNLGRYGLKWESDWILLILKVNDMIGFSFFWFLW